MRLSWLCQAERKNKVIPVPFLSGLFMSQKMKLLRLCQRERKNKVIPVPFLCGRSRHGSLRWPRPSSCDQQLSPEIAVDQHVSSAGFVRQKKREEDAIFY
jgi:hypothetical protein